MDIATLAFRFARWTVVTVLAALISVVVGATVRERSQDRAPVREGRPGADGAFEIVVRQLPPQTSGQSIRRYLLRVEVLNRGNTSVPAFRSSVLHVGIQSFPAEVFEGLAFHDSILPGFGAAGVVGYDIPAGSVPDRVDFDLDGDGVMLVVELDPSRDPP